MKKLVFLFAMVFAVSMAMGQNSSTVTQSGGDDNDAYTEQVGDINEIFINQVLPDGAIDAYNEAGDPDGDPIKQEGNYNIARLEQIVITEDNAYNFAKIKQEGNRNKLVGATDDALLDNDNSKATQSSRWRNNSLNTLQKGHRNKIGLYQTLNYASQFGTPEADVRQVGNDNEFVVYQAGSHNGIVDVSSEQIGYENLARVKQTGGNEKRITVVQHGDNNKLIGAKEGGEIDWDAGTHAEQFTSGTPYTQDLWVSQGGDNNVIGLYGSATGFNDAWISQSNGNNSLGAYQTTTSGKNNLTVTQTGGDVSNVYQTGGGDNIANIVQ